MGDENLLRRSEKGERKKKKNIYKSHANLFCSFVCFVMAFLFPLRHFRRGSYLPIQFDFWFFFFLLSAREILFIACLGFCLVTLKGMFSFLFKYDSLSLANFLSYFDWNVGWRAENRLLGNISIQLCVLCSEFSHGMIELFGWLDLSSI